MNDDAGKAAFVERYGGVYEHSPWVPERCWPIAANADNAGLVRLFREVVERASKDRQLALIRAHPDLAGKAAVRGELTADSSEEQASAGIDRCSREEYEEFQRLNTAYHKKFGYPFVMAVRDSNRREILAAFAKRLGNNAEDEFAAAIGEIHKIAALRLGTMT